MKVDTYTIDIQSGLLKSARHLLSQHYDDRRFEGDIDLLVIHNISLPPNQFGGPYIDQLFTGKLNPNEHPYFEQISNLRVSSHLLIRRDGEMIQYVPFHKRAWHAGVSSFEGRDNCNDYSIGIELEGGDDIDYEPVQYQVLVAVTESIFKAYPKINIKRIAGHSDIAPGRKTDPGPSFNWQMYRDLLSQN